MENYSVMKTAGKAAPSFVIIILVNAIMAALKQAGVTIEDSVVYNIAIAGVGAVASFINWLKHHKKTPAK
jgi:hypothetical protein